jgi:hypothetical protein
MSPWQVLGVGHDASVSDLRRHYAALIKQFRPETHPQDFARIREAYEVALPHARRREAEAVAEIALEAQEDVAIEPAAPFDAEADTPVATLEDVAAEASEPGEIVVATALRDDAPPDGESSLAARFHAFHALAQPAAGTDDEALLPALRELLQARTQASLDDSQALEFALMRWFIESEAPPLTLLFETGRAFDWHVHVTRLSSWLAPWALRQMEARLALSRDLVHARHFTRNAWLRGLHSPRPHRASVVLRPAAVEAQHWAERWRRGCEDADTPALEAGLNATTLARLRGFASTDLLAGLMVAALSPDLPTAALAGAGTAAAAFLSRRLLQAIMRLAPEHRVRVALRALLANRYVTAVFVALTGIPGLVLTIGQGVPPGSLAIGVVLIAPAILAGLALLWRVAAWVELVAARPFQWREAVDRLEFRRFLDSRATPGPNQPFGRRLGFAQRLQAIGEARRLQARELAARERPPRALPFAPIRIRRTASGNNSWRFVWYGLWALFVVARALHAWGR